MCEVIWKIIFHHYHHGSCGAIFMTLAFAIFMALAGGTDELGELAFGLALVGQVLSVMVMADAWQNLRDQSMN